MRLQKSRPALLPAVDDLVALARPEEPMLCLRPEVLADTARAFRRAFPGETLYAVKCNPDAAVLRALWEGGVRHFDCASIGEVRQVRGLFPAAEIHFMHPIKARSAIREAYAEHGVRDFVLDSAEEFSKILAETGNAADLGIFVRLGLPKGSARYDLSGKFGATPEDAAALLAAARPHAVRLGLSFHVGSQCMEPESYTRALLAAGEVVRAAGVAVEIVDVGGGFPVAYPDMAPPALSAFMAAIARGYAQARLPAGTKLWAEPGRALVAGGASLIVQVQARRGDALFINDGIYGTLSDAGVPGFRFPVRPLRASAAPLVDYSFFGPTCDSADAMRGPFPLPADMAEGDWIEIGQLGAYGACLGSGFNGFAAPRIEAVRDRPLLETPGLTTRRIRAA
ncbi:type III PLP-dependent enzyme [Roseomonas hellenica]|uniref:ornithine decarboxylase n=1 Tax=Plastoroseomonas hellenica TaxID=2687306 RepID=A0ABS5EZT5_9PROT|nr:type III PLP-dependent enzyme [Plastoroseomonas hellenica]MBR0665802.1 type III PLP-dependent enzyme [Plastoroseomonas hellenica]